MPSRPVQNRDTITSLIVVGAMLLDADVGGEAFTLEQLMKKMRELLRPGQILAADDVRPLLPGMGHCLAPCSTAGGGSGVNRISGLTAGGGVVLPAFPFSHTAAHDGVTQWKSPRS